MSRSVLILDWRVLKTSQLNGVLCRGWVDEHHACPQRMLFQILSWILMLILLIRFVFRLYLFFFSGFTAVARRVALLTKVVWVVDRHLKHCSTRNQVRVLHRQHNCSRVSIHHCPIFQRIFLLNEPEMVGEVVVSWRRSILGAFDGVEIHDIDHHVLLILT